MSLKGVHETAHLDGELVVTYPHAQWLELPEDEQNFSPAAIEFATQVLEKKFKHERRKRISASGIGGCPRAALFSYVGAPQVGANLDSEGMMGEGTIQHLWWQIEGLSFPYDRPWLSQAEVWVHDEKLRLGGSMDGVLYNGDLFELKTVAWGKYNRIVLQNKYPEFEHLLQMHAYFKLANINTGSLVYTDRNSGQFHEFRVIRDESIEKELERRLSRLHGYIDVAELPPMLDDCEQRRGPFKDCFYRKFCPMAGDTLPWMED